MISEKIFCSNFSTFWRETLPNLEAVVRAMNLGYERVSNPRVSRSSPSRRDLVSESGYRLFFLSKGSPELKLDNLLEEASLAAYEYLKARTSEFWNEDFYLDFREEAEIIALCDWLKRYFVKLDAPLSQVVRPYFKGHGIISSCYGDFQAGDFIYEMKYVERNFRGSDLRQLLTYASLRYYDTGIIYRGLCVVNPLKGIQFRTTINDIVDSAYGLSAVEFFNRMSYAVSCGEVSH